MVFVEYMEVWGINSESAQIRSNPHGKCLNLTSEDAATYRSTRVADCGDNHHDKEWKLNFIHNH